MSIKSLLRCEDCYKSDQIKIKAMIFFFFFFYKMELFNALLLKQIFVTMKLII